MLEKMGDARSMDPPPKNLRIRIFLMVSGWVGGMSLRERPTANPAIKRNQATIGPNILSIHRRRLRFMD